MNSTLSNFGNDFLEPLRYLCDVAWEDFAKPCSVSIADGLELAGLSSEARAFWHSLPDAVHGDMLAHSLRRKWEKAELARNLQEFDAFAASFFVASRENFVRRLCVRLQYLLSPILDYAGDLQDFRPDPCLEGHVGSLELLHVCSEHPECNKYQVLYSSHEAAKKYRQAFIYNNGHQNLGSSLLHELIVFQAVLLSENAVADAALVEELASFVRRQEAFSGRPDLPESCTQESAWAALCLAMQSPSYWFSPEELHFLAATVKCKVNTYLHVTDGDECTELKKIEAPFPLPVAHDWPEVNAY